MLTFTGKNGLDPKEARQAYRDQNESVHVTGIPFVFRARAKRPSSLLGDGPIAVQIFSPNKR